MGSSSMLIVKELVKSYDKKQVLHGVSFEASAGQIVGLLGPNGAGKSTVMKLLTGYIKADRGEAWLNGEEITKSLSVEFKRQIGYLPEHNPLYLDMYVREYLGFVAEMYALKNKKQAVAEAIEKTGLGAEAHKQIGQLSKGYRQRVGLAQAIIHNPKILILDEPTTGLDPNQIFDIRSLIQDYGKEHTVLFSTHILQEVAAICTNVVMINHGEIFRRLQGEEITVDRLEQEFASIKQ